MKTSKGKLESNITYYLEMKNGTFDEEEARKVLQSGRSVKVYETKALFRPYEKEVVLNHFSRTHNKSKTNQPSAQSSNQETHQPKSSPNPTAYSIPLRKFAYATDGQEIGALLEEYHQESSVYKNTRRAGVWLIRLAFYLPVIASRFRPLLDEIREAALADRAAFCNSEELPRCARLSYLRRLPQYVKEWKDVVVMEKATMKG